jgi:hypothetical protein
VSHGASSGGPVDAEVAFEDLDNPIERLRLIAGDDDAVAAFLDDIDVRSPRERVMLAELARRNPLARPTRFDADHRRVVEALESLRRHGHHGSRVAGAAGPLRHPVRWLVQLIARYIVVSHVKDVVVSMRNLYWLREMEAEKGSPERALLTAARQDAQGLTEVMRSREIGVPSFVIAGLLIPLAASIWRLASGFTFDSWWLAALVGVAGAAIGVGLSWVVLRGTAMASRRIRLALREPLEELWRSVGHCGGPPRDTSRRFAITSITLMAGVWIVIPTLIALAIAT